MLDVLRAGPARIPERLADWATYDALAPGEGIVVSAPGGRLEGVYRGVDGDGRLRLEIGSRILRISTGEAHSIRSV